MNGHPWRRGVLAALCAAATAAAAPPKAGAPLPNETLTMAPLQAADAHRIYLSDPAMGHLVDGRLHIVDGASMRYLGMLGTGFAAETVLSPDRRTLYVATTYLSRLQRGARTDVVEVYDSADLTLQHEIEIPPRRAQSLPIKALLAVTPDSRYLLIQNATPATSVTVVDLPARKVVAEVPNPGCWGVIPWPSAPDRYSSVCGDGTLATVRIGADGKTQTLAPSKAFFDPDQDPVFMHYELLGNELIMVSYHGQVHAVALEGDRPTPREPWSLLDAASRNGRWAPGGYALFALDPETRRLYVGMHDGQAEGSHKNPAKQIWVVDLRTHKRVQRLPGELALSMALSRTAPRKLFVLSAANNTLVGIDTANRKARPLRSAPVGETPIYLEMH